MLRLDALTAQQAEATQQCVAHPRVHLSAPAGAGKTFVALHRLLRLLRDDAAATALFVARNQAPSTHRNDCT